LQPVNDAEEVFENGSWLVKNANGKVTATWDATENVWDYNAEALTMISGGASKPVGGINLEAFVEPGATYSVPDAWMTALPENQVDPSPLVPLGVINQIDLALGVGTEYEQHIRMIEIGVDFRGITPLSKSPEVAFDQYVAVFTLSTPDHPDILYTLQIPVPDITDIGPSFDLHPGGVTDSSYGVLVDPANPGANSNLNDSELIKVLQDPKTIGRRMVIDVTVPTPEFNTDILASDENQKLIDAMSQGKSIDGMETTLVPRSFRLPSDLDTGN
jgi:hypothetical protein